MSEKFETWVIAQPGTGAPVFCDSFAEAMDKWFEGFNPPKKAMVTLEPASESSARVRHYYETGRHAEQKEPT